MRFLAYCLLACDAISNDRIRAGNRRSSSIGNRDLTVQRTWALIFAVVALGGCSSSLRPAEPESTGELWTNSPPVCGEDEVREYQCEELLPISPAMPAAAPYQNCPASLDAPNGVH